MTTDSNLNQPERAHAPGSGIDPMLFDAVEQVIERAHRAHQNGRDPSADVPSKPSALRVAILRAVHQLLDVPLVFEDPLALGILGADGEECLRNDASLFDSPRVNGFRASMVVRSKLTEDEWAESQESGVRQYVILGAGLDTFAYRNPDHLPCRVFEVDLPEMMQWKRQCLRIAGIAEPEALTFVPTDFEHTSLCEALRQAGLDEDRPAFFSWLGVTFYLDEEAMMQMLRYVGSLPKGSAVVFDYAVHPDALPQQEQQAMKVLIQRMAERGEPWKTCLNPISLVEALHAMGFTDVHDFTAEQVNERYLSGRSDGLRKGIMTRIIRARV